jgi:N-acetyl-anhydromuramyl-L-alanine amidase AmpD
MDLLTGPVWPQIRYKGRGSGGTDLGSMTHLRRISPVVFAALALALPGAALAAPSPNELAANTNYTQAERPMDAIRFIVIHVTEGGFGGTVAWLRDPRAHASANFVVGRDGHVQELVPLHDIAWHAGNWAVNTRSIGIENVGFTDDPSGFTGPEYRAAAKIAAVVARRSLIPIDRQHIIGHSQVPDPDDPLQGGGIDRHTDPGTYWHWGYFMKLVQRFAYPQKWWRAKHVGLDIQSSTVYGGQVVAGHVPWRTKVGGPVKRVSFLVDGKVRWVDHLAPFAFAGGKPLNTTTLRNGKHRLELRAYGSKAWTRRVFTIRVRNEPFTLAQVAFKPRQQVSGVVPVRAIFTGTPVRVQLLLDGREIDHDTSAPYLFKWDTRRAKDGPHTIALTGRAPDGRLVRSAVTVVVNNAAVLPKIVGSSIANGVTVSDVEHWLVQVSGKVDEVEFSVDGVVRGTATAAPYAWDWDTTAETPGPHQLLIRAVGPNGTAAAQQSLTVTVAGPAAAG